MKTVYADSYPQKVDDLIKQFSKWKKKENIKVVSLEEADMNTGGNVSFSHFRPSSFTEMLMYLTENMNGLGWSRSTSCRWSPVVNSFFQSCIG